MQNMQKCSVRRMWILCSICNMHFAVYADCAVCVAFTVCILYAVFNVLCTEHLAVCAVIAVSAV